MTSNSNPNMEKDQEMTSIAAAAAATREDSEAQFDPTISAQEANQVQAQEQIFAGVPSNPSQEVEMDSNSRPASRAHMGAPTAIPSDSEEDDDDAAGDDGFDQHQAMTSSTSQIGNVNDLLGKSRLQGNRGQDYARSAKGSHASPSKRKATKGNRSGGMSGARRFDTGPNGLDDDFGGRDEPLLDEFLRQKYLKLGDIFHPSQKAS